jgi:hypothetical protein
MIQVTAQRVRSRERSVGINAYVYRHDAVGEPVWPTLDEDPGQLIGEQRQVPPGFNEVLSYLDVAAEGLDPEALLNAIETLDGFVAMQDLPIVESVKGVEIRFGAVLGLSGEPARLELHNLGRSAIAVLRTATGGLVQSRKPVKLEREQTPDGFVYRYPGRPIAVSVPADVDSDFEQIFGGPLLPHIAQSLTGMSIHELISVGGVEVTDAKTGNVVQRWNP